MKKRQIAPKTRDSFRVVALMSAYNEGDFISPVIQHLVENGVEVYLLDNRSTDDTVEQANRWRGQGLIEIETFPDERDDRYRPAAERYDWTAILRRKEELAGTLDADWFLHYDADEIRESPWPGVTLRDAIKFVDALNFNCIDFRIFEFPPVDDGYRQGMDPKTYFTRYRAAGSYDQLQLKGWKARVGPISLVRLGGHDVEFEHRRVFPIPFLLRHYPIRGQSHGRRKVFQERKPRFVAEERAKTWHIQYDHIQDESHSFLADPEMLRPFDLDWARLDALVRNRDALERIKAAEAEIASLSAKLEAAEQRLQAESDALVQKTTQHESEKRALAVLSTQRDAERLALASLAKQLGSVQQQLESALDALVRRETEHESDRRGLEQLIANRDAERLAAAQANARASELEAELAATRAQNRLAAADLTRRIAELEAHLARATDGLRAASETRSALEAELQRLRGLLQQIVSSKTFRWSEPVGRFLLALRRPTKKKTTGVESDGRTQAPTLRQSTINKLRALKFRLMAGGPVKRSVVPFLEVPEFWLSHGFREVIVRSRLRLRGMPGPKAMTQSVTRLALPPSTPTTDVKLIAFYLPQYHPIPENDRAWGKGFTEWTNTTRARPLFDGHYQPHVPSDLGYYDLRVSQTREEQARLARTHGIHGFCYYYYWFDRQRLLSLPLDEVLQSGTPGFPFCICWANEPWSRRWDGSENDIIAAQPYRAGYAERFIEDVIPILEDPRYIRVDGRLLLVVYRIDQLPDAAAAAEVWRHACRQAGLGEICLAAMGTYGTTDPLPFGFDVSIEFPPHNLTVVPTIEHTVSGLRRTFDGRIFDYRRCAEAELRRRPAYPQFRGLMTGWDNTARRGDHALLFHNATPAAYEYWLGGLLNLAKDASAPYSPFIFINAWNEWAEGAHLEPDQKFEYQYLEATASALFHHKYRSLFETGFPIHTAPVDVAIVIPAYNHVDLTLACLDALARHQTRWSVQVIVVDDGSTDPTERLISAIPGIRYVRAENQGFVRSCNAGAAEATAEYVVFLNNDTVVQDGWLDELRGTFEIWPQAGLAGSKLVWPDGRMQECGGLIYRDGSAENYGREGDPDDPRYAYARETDYVSGAAMMMRRDLFERLGGFDDLYAPAYYEDVDLAFRVRQAGRSVVVNPRAVVIHHEGGTAGLDVTAGTKRYQVINHDKFRRRWAHVLEHFPERDGRRRVAKREDRILVIDWVLPRPDRDAGSVRMVAILTILRSLGFHVTFVARDASYDSQYAWPLERMGIEVLRQPFIASVQAYLASEGDAFGHVMISRRDVAVMHMRPVKALCPNARVVFDTVDLHFIREHRQQAVQPAETAGLAEHFANNRREEIDLVRMADVTIVVSPSERDELTRVSPGSDVRIISTVHHLDPSPRPFADRAGLLFVGYFVHAPNADAIRWFVRDVLPHLHIDDPEFRVHVVGSDPPADILGMASDRIKIHGYVADLDALFDECRLSIAPLRYGAGVKGKIGHSLALGVPCVTTSIGAEGMGLEDGSSAMIADAPADFARRIERVYSDEKLWLALRNGGLAVIERQMSADAARRELQQLFASRRVAANSSLVAGSP